MAEGVRPCGMANVRQWLIALSSLAAIFLAAHLNNLRQDDPFLPGGRQKVIDFGDRILLQKSGNLAFDFAANYPGGTNLSKRNYRLVPPLIARVVGLRGLRGVELLAYLTLGACVYFSLSRISQRVAFCGTIATICTSSGACYFNDWGHSNDVMAHAFLALNLVVAMPVLTVVSVMAALFTDERAVLLVPVVAAVSLLRGARRSLWPCVAGCGAYLVARLLLGRIYAPTHYQDVGGWDVVLGNLRLWPMVVWSSLEGAWIMVVGTSVLIYQRAKLAAILLPAYAVAAASLSVCVLDMTRSAAYVILVPVLAVLLMRHYQVSERTIFILCAVAALVSLALPNSLFIAGYIEMWR